MPTHSISSISGRSRLRKYLLPFAAAVCVYILCCCIAGIFVAENTLHPGREPEISAAETSDWINEDGATLSPVNISAANKISLYAWIVKPANANGDTVLVLHGMGGDRTEMEDYADMFLRHGFSVLMPDARAHGKSGGELATYGLLERDDVRYWVEWLLSREPSGCVYGFGESMGAAQLLQSLKTEPRFCAVAAECSFSTFREVAYDRMGQRLHTGPWLGRTFLWPVVESAFVFVRLRYGFDMDLVSPEEAVAASHVPVLLIHGEADANIPIRHSHAIAARNSTVVLWEVPNTGHSGAIGTSPKEFEMRVIGWFSSHRR